jgi:two-component system chemotaxis response regulator CheV
MKTDILLETGTNELEVLEFTWREKLRNQRCKSKRADDSAMSPAFTEWHPCVEGVFQPRDEVYTVIDLAAYLGMPPSEDATKDITSSRISTA